MKGLVSAIRRASSTAHHLMSQLDEFRIELPQFVSHRYIKTMAGNYGKLGGSGGRWRPSSPARRQPRGRHGWSSASRRLVPPHIWQCGGTFARATPRASHPTLPYSSPPPLSPPRTRKCFAGRAVPAACGSTTMGLWAMRGCRPQRVGPRGCVAIGDGADRCSSGRGAVSDLGGGGSSAARACTQPSVRELAVPAISGPNCSACKRGTLVRGSFRSEGRWRKCDDPPPPPKPCRGTQPSPGANL